VLDDANTLDLRPAFSLSGRPFSLRRPFEDAKKATVTIYNSMKVVWQAECLRKPEIAVLHEDCVNSRAAFFFS